MKIEILFFLFFFGRKCDVEYELITENIKLNSSHPYFGISPYPRGPHTHTDTHNCFLHTLNPNISRTDSATDSRFSPNESLTSSLLIRFSAQNCLKRPHLAKKRAQRFHHIFLKFPETHFHKYNRSFSQCRTYLRMIARRISEGKSPSVATHS